MMPDPAIGIDSGCRPTAPMTQSEWTSSMVPSSPSGKASIVNHKQRPGSERGDGLDDHQVEQHLVDARQAVLRLAELSGMVPHLDLGDARPGDRRHGRNEAVHFRVQRNLLDQGCAERLQRAAIVLDGHAGHFADDPVGDPRGDLARDQLVLAIEAPADDDVVAFLDLVQEVADVRQDRSAGRRPS